MKKDVTGWIIDSSGKNRTDREVRMNRENRIDREIRMERENRTDRKSRGRGARYQPGKRAAALLLGWLFLCAAALTRFGGVGNAGGEGAHPSEPAITVAITSETEPLDA